MQNVCRVVHTFLESAVEMGKCLRAGSEAETFAEVVSTRRAIVAVAAHNAGFDGHALSWYDVGHAWTDSSNDARSFVAEDKGRLKGKVPVPAMDEVVNYNEFRWSVLGNGDQARR